MIRAVLFDLDGTLTDPAEGITNCVEYALEKFDIHPSSKEELYPYIGPPLTYSFTNYHGLSQANAEQAVAYYRERFSEKGLFENQVYEGIAELLRELKRLLKSVQVTLFSASRQKSSPRLRLTMIRSCLRLFLRTL